MTQPLLTVEGLSAGYGEVRVLREVSLRVRAGSVTALIGSNGAGQTTLTRAIAGLLPVTGGRIGFDGTPITGQAPSRRVALGISLVPEGRAIFPDFTVEENLRMGAYVRRARAGHDGRRAAMYALFPKLAERRRQRAETLSGGEQQMLALDEPSLGLAPLIVARLFEAVREINRAGVTILIVEQNLRATLEIADYAYVLENGRIVQEGADLIHDPPVKTHYLGL